VRTPNWRRTGSRIFGGRRKSMFNRALVILAAITAPVVVAVAQQGGSSGRRCRPSIFRLVTRWSALLPKLNQAIVLAVILILAPKAPISWKERLS
jgi:hypothetical protein